MSGASGKAHISAHLSPRDEGTTAIWDILMAERKARGGGEQRKLLMPLANGMLLTLHLPPVKASHKASLTLGGPRSSPGEAWVGSFTLV